MLRPGGVATIIGMIPFGTKIELHGADFLRDRKIQGTSMGGNRFRVDMPRLLELWRQGRLKLDHSDLRSCQAGSDQRGFRDVEIRCAGAQPDQLWSGISARSAGVGHPLPPCFGQRLRAPQACSSSALSTRSITPAQSPRRVWRNCRIWGTRRVVTIQEPAPAGIEPVQHPHRFAQRARQMRHRRIHRDYQIRPAISAAVSSQSCSRPETSCSTVPPAAPASAQRRSKLQRDQTASGNREQRHHVGQSHRAPLIDRHRVRLLGARPTRPNEPDFQARQFVGDGPW